jgi:hypothetical protein
VNYPEVCQNVLKGVPICWQVAIGLHHKKYPANGFSTGIVTGIGVLRGQIFLSIDMREGNFHPCYDPRRIIFHFIHSPALTWCRMKLYS